MIYFEFIRQNTIVVTITLNINTFLKLHYMIISVTFLQNNDLFRVLTHLFYKSTRCSYLFKQTLLFGNHKLLFVCSVQGKHKITSIIHNQYLQLTGVQIESL